MRRSGYMGLLAFLILVNTVVLGGVIWNRSGGSDTTLRLTERELPLIYRYTGQQENSGMALRLQMHYGTSPLITPWLDEEKLRELGFKPETLLREDGKYKKAAKRPESRRVWAVLEFDGPAWQRVIARSEASLLTLRDKLNTGDATHENIEHLEERHAVMKRSGSRLVAIDADNNVEVLRLRYPDRTRYLITPAKVRMHFAYKDVPQTSSKPGVPFEKSSEQRERILTGTLQLVNRRIHVPLPFRQPLLEALGATERDYYGDISDNVPRYSVSLHTGKRFEPWISEVDSLPTQ